MTNYTNNTNNNNEDVFKNKKGVRIGDYWNLIIFLFKII